MRALWWLIFCPALSSCAMGELYREVSSSQTEGGDGACAITIFDEARCWGKTGVDGLFSPPSDPMQQISLGFAHACGLRMDNTLVCWGQGTQEVAECEPGDQYSCGQAVAPTGTFKSVSAGYDHTCAIDSNDALQCWGSDNSGESTPPSASAFARVSSGWDFTCGIELDGDPICWGIGIDLNATWEPGPYVDISSSKSASACALDANGAIHCVGPREAPSGTFTALANGLSFACAIDLEGSAVCFDDGESELNPYYEPPSGAYNDIAIGSAALGLMTDGTVRCWGSTNTCGEQ